MHFGLRRKELCEGPRLCPKAPDDGGRCARCPLTKLEEAERAELGHLLRRALDVRAILNIGVPLTLEDIAADELLAMLIVEEERDKYDEELSQKRE